jgi:hypothetical protein
VQLVQLLLGDLDLLQCRGDVVERQKPAFLPLRDEAAKLIQLMDWRFVRQQNFRLDRSAPLKAAAAVTTDVASPLASGISTS